jgi:uncharacterized protein YkwD
MIKLQGWRSYVRSGITKIVAFSILVFMLYTVLCYSQDEEPLVLNTARDCSYMKDVEKEMISEINLLRSDPAGYIRYLDYDYKLAKLNFEHFGRGEKRYSLNTTFRTVNGVGSRKRVDTVWTYEYEEQLRAVESLMADLRKMKSLPVLEPDHGIYEAAAKHGHDQDRHNWSLGHQGSDGSWPWDRITKFSPAMTDGNENLAGAFPQPTVRGIVIQLLIDAGIPEYGHRTNLLNPKWTHVACYTSGLKAGMYQWIQDFGAKR